MQIASHHRKSHPLAKETSYEPSCAWPEECTVQWGGGGVVIGKESSYRTAFFEAFPGEAYGGGFIRGEGKTIKDAEVAAFSKWQKEFTCQEHRWCRKGYTNGGGFCANCGAFKVVFKDIVKLGEWARPLNSSEISALSAGFFVDDPDDRPSTRRYHRRLVLKAKLAGITLPDPNDIDPSITDAFDRDTEFYEMCEKALVDYYVENRGRLRAVDNGKSAIGTFFDKMALQSLELMASRRG